MKTSMFVFAVVWTIIAVELYLRIFQPIPILPRYIQASNYGIRENIPDASYKHRTPEYVVELNTNSQGIRDSREFDPAKSDETARVVLLGDSFAIGYGVNYEESVPALLEARLAQELKRPVEIINLGVSGFGTAEELIALQERGWQYEPDLVLVYWHAGDPADNVRSNLFKLKEEGLVRSNDSYLPAVEIREFLFSFSAYRWIAEHSHFYSWVRDFAGKHVKSLLETMRSAPEPIVRQEGIPQRIKLTLALLERIRTEARSHGAGMLILEIPVRVDRTTFKSTFPSEAAESLGFAFDVVNPTPAFQEHEGKKIYWEKSHGHWTPLGASCVAAELADRILEDGLLSHGTRPEDEGR